MRTGIIAFLIAVSLYLWLNAYSVRHTPPNTYVGFVNVGNLTRAEALAKLSKEEERLLLITIDGREYRFNKRKEGIHLDYGATVDRLFSHSRSAVPFVAYARAYGGQRLVLPVMKFDMLYHARFEDRTADTNILAQKIITSFGAPTPIEAEAPPKPVAAITEKSDNTLENMSKDALYVVLQRGDIVQSFSLNPGVLEGIINYNGELSLREEKIPPLIESLEKAFFGNSQLHLDEVHFRQNIMSALIDRANGGSKNYITALVKSETNTDGKRAPKYIEIDIAQQRMYLWENGFLIRTYPVSTGLHYPTPPGEYAIMNKTPNAYSDIYHVWMPYWMAFYRDPKVNAYLGIHELPYWVDTDGQQQRRPRNFIGAPHTGGCVSLDIGSAQEVYMWAEVGTPVFIFS